MKGRAECLSDIDPNKYAFDALHMSHDYISGFSPLGSIVNLESTLHEQGHAVRTMVLSWHLGMLTKEYLHPNRRSVLSALAVHDIHRGTDDQIEPRHGLDARRWCEAQGRYSGDPDEQLILWLIENHCSGPNFPRDVPVQWTDSLLLMRHADALDRVRGSDGGDLDTNYLTLPESKELVPYAQALAKQSMEDSYYFYDPVRVVLNYAYRLGLKIPYVTL